MRKIHVVLFFLLFLGGCQKQKKPSSEDADLVIRNARVYTARPSRNQNTSASVELSVLSFSSADILLQSPEIKVLASLRTDYKLRGVPRLRIICKSPNSTNDTEENAPCMSLSPNTRTKSPARSQDLTA